MADNISPSESKEPPLLDPVAGNDGYDTVASAAASVAAVRPPRLNGRWGRLVAALGRHAFGFECCGLALILIAYAAFQIALWNPLCIEIDTAGYVDLAWRFARGESPAFAPDDPLRHHAHVWVTLDDGRVMAKYPPGHPLLMAIGIRLFGRAGAYAVSPVCGALALCGLWLLLRREVRPGFALAGTFLLASHPMFLFYAAYPLAHAADVCCVVWGLYALSVTARTLSRGAACAAGVCLAFAMAVRPMSGLLVVPVFVVGVALFFAARGDRSARRRAVAAVAWLWGGFAVVAAAHAWYNVHFFGHPWSTGYALPLEQGAFSYAQWKLRIVAVLRGMNDAWMPFLLIPGFLGLFLVGQRALRNTALWLVLTTITLYAAYYWGDAAQWSYLRFFIVLMPLFILGTMRMLESFRRLAGPVSWGAFVLGGVALLGVHYGMGMQHRGMVEGGHLTAHRMVRETLEQHMPARAILFAGFGGEILHDWFPDATVYDLDHFRPDHIERAFRRDDRWFPRVQPARAERIKAWYRAQPKDGLLLARTVRGLRMAESAEPVESGESVRNSAEIWFLISTAEEARYRRELGAEHPLRAVATVTVPAMRHGREGETRLLLCRMDGP